MLISLLERCAGLRPGDLTTPLAAAKHALRLLARRTLALREETKGPRAELDRLTTLTCPALVAMTGIGPDTAAALLISAGDNPQRLRTEAAVAALCGTNPDRQGRQRRLKVATVVAGMVAGADSIDDMAVLRHGGLGRLFDRAYAPSTWGSFLRSFTFGHVRQLDAVASRFLTGLAAVAPTFTGASDDLVLVDVDDTIIEAHGYAKQGSGYGYSGVRGLNALLATVTTASAAPVIVAQRLRKGACGSPRGAGRLVADAVTTVQTLHAGRTGKPLLRADAVRRSTATRRCPQPGQQAPTCR